MDHEEPMDWEPAPPIFTEEEYQEWLAYNAKANSPLVIFQVQKQNQHHIKTFTKSFNLIK